MEDNENPSFLWEIWEYSLKPLCEVLLGFAILIAMMFAIVVIAVLGDEVVWPYLWHNYPVLTGMVCVGLFLAIAGAALGGVLSGAFMGIGKMLIPRRRR